MDDICSHLKISKKTLYQYFSNKDDLVEQIMMHRRNNYRTQKDIEELKQHNSGEIMLTIRDHIIRSFNSRMPANLFDLKKYHPDVYQRVNNKDQIFIQNLFNEVIDNSAFAIQVICPEKKIETCIAEARESLLGGKAAAAFRKFVEINS